MLGHKWEDDNFWLQWLLRGMSNHQDSKTKVRKAMTIDRLRNLKTKLSASRLDLRFKRLIWLASTLLFCGCLRSVEILCPTESTFSETETLLSRDVDLSFTSINEKPI